MKYSYLYKNSLRRIEQSVSLQPLVQIERKGIIIIDNSIYIYIYTISLANKMLNVIVL
jgi:hypothetical protein